MIEQAIADYLSNLPGREVCEKYNIAISTLYGHLRKRGIKTSQRRLLTYEEKRFIEANHKTMLTIDIAKRFGYKDTRTILKYIAKISPFAPLVGKHGQLLLNFGDVPKQPVQKPVKAIYYDDSVVTPDPPKQKPQRWPAVYNNLTTYYTTALNQIRY